MASITLGAGRQTFVFERDSQGNTITDFKSQYFLSSLDEAQEVPPNPDIPAIDGSGVGALNFARTAFDFTLDINGIDLAGGPDPDDMIDMHIHGAPVGATGPVIFDFRNDAETEIDPAAGTVTAGWDTVEAVALDMTAADIAALLAGETYFNIHTNRDPAGFIRGQILRDGSAVDRIDVSALNIGSFASLQAITGQTAGDAVMRVLFDGEVSALRLDGVSEATLQASDFVFAGNVAETLDGTIDRDDLFGAGGGDRMNGFTGADRIFGETGADTVFGGGGRDLLSGGLGQDRAFGGIGDDTSFGGAGGDLLSGGLGQDRAFGGIGDDTVVGGAGRDLLSDGFGQDRVFGGVGADTVFGGAGSDVLSGGLGQDRVFGGVGDDTVFGGAGSDSLSGGLGQDLLSGGSLADHFQFNSVADSAPTAAQADRIAGFVAGLDDIVLSAIDAVAGVPGNQAFTFIGSDAFDVEGQVRVTQFGGNTFVSLNTIGAGGNEAVIRLDGTVAIGESDFIL